LHVISDRSISIGLAVHVSPIKRFKAGRLCGSHTDAHESHLQRGHEVASVCVTHCISRFNLLKYSMACKVTHSTNLGKWSCAFFFATRCMCIAMYLRTVYLCRCLYACTVQRVCMYICIMTQLHQQSLLPMFPRSVCTPVPGATYDGLSLPDPSTDLCVVSILRAADSMADCISNQV